MKIINIVTALLSLLVSTSLFSHRGGTIKSGRLKGCHQNRKDGGFHCHSKSKYDDMQFSSEEEAFAYMEKQDSKVKLAKKPPKLRVYSRTTWKHWIDKNHDCKNERMEILIRESLIPVTFNKKGCTVISGKWEDFYYNEILTSASKIDIDHVVPLKHASDFGGLNWSKAKKRKFANDPLNMVITNLKYNRSKGSQSITTWNPISKSYTCKYMKRWFAVKKKYELRMAKEEIDSFESMDCN